MIRIFPLIFLAWACQQEPVTPEGVTLIDLSSYEQEPVPGSEVLRLTKRNATGQITEEGFAKKGIREGIWTTYHAQAPHIPYVVSTYQNGALNGMVMEFNNIGRIEKMAHYLNGQLDGVSMSYRNAKVEQLEEYKAGKRHGKFIVYFPQSDQIQREVSFKDGVEDGKALFYDEQGALIMEYTYKNGEKIGGGIIEK